MKQSPSPEAGLNPDTSLSLLIKRQRVRVGLSDGLALMVSVGRKTVV